MYTHNDIYLLTSTVTTFPITVMMFKYVCTHHFIYEPNETLSSVQTRLMTNIPLQYCKQFFQNRPLICCCFLLAPRLAHWRRTRRAVTEVETTGLDMFSLDRPSVTALLRRVVRPTGVEIVRQKKVKASRLH